MYGRFDRSLEIDGESFRADLIEPPYAEGAGFEAIYAIDGLPARFERDLIAASQVCDVPHTWRVQQCESVDDVTPELLKRGKAALDADRKERNASIICYVGVTPAYVGFAAAGAIRNKLTKSYLNNAFPVISRAIVHPHFRGKRLGTMIVEHRAKLLIHGYFGVPPKAIHFGTESPKVLQSIKSVERDEGVKFVYIGDERYTTADGTHTVNDYLCFMPDYQKALLAACEPLPQFRDRLALFMSEGVSAVSGDALAAEFETLRGALDEPAQALLAEMFEVRGVHIEAADPVRGGH